MGQVLFLFLGIGNKVQSLADKELERITSGALAEGISCSEDAIRYAGIVVNGDCHRQCGGKRELFLQKW